MNKRPIVIIGSGLAGYMLAKEFRKVNNTEPLMILTASDGTFYSKPLLSNSLTAKRDIAKLTTADAATMASQLSAKMHVATEAIRINTEDKVIETLSGVFPYEKLVLATGACAIKPPLLGNASDVVSSVNDLEDYARFCEMIHGKKKLAILGAGLVGCEFANDLIKTGHEVHVIDPASYPLQRLLPELLGRVLERSLAKEGLHWHFGKLVSEINRVDDQYDLTLSHQQILKVETVMSAIGLRPNVKLANASGIKTNYGVLVNRFLETSAQDVYALGDCAEVNGLVLFFVAPLLQCAKALAQTLTGNPVQVIYPVMPVVLKTPSCPIVIASPPSNLPGEWKIEGEGDDFCARYYDSDFNLCGFALTGRRVAEKNTLINTIRPLFI